MTSWYPKAQRTSISAACFLMICLSPAEGMMVHCPHAGPDLTVSGPKIKTKMDGQVLVTCQYKDGTNRGELQVTFYKERDDAPDCAGLPRGRHTILSESYVAYVHYDYRGRSEAYNKEFWAGLAKDLLSNTAPYALTCQMRASEGLSGIQQQNQKLRTSIGQSSEKVRQQNQKLRKSINQSSEKIRQGLGIGDEDIPPPETPPGEEDTLVSDASDITENSAP